LVKVRENYVGKPRKVGKHLKKDAKQEFMDAYSNIKTGMKKNLSKENLKAMGKKISEESKKPANQVIMSAVPMGKAPKIAKAVKAAGKAVKNAVGAGKPKSLAKSYDPSIPFKPDYKPPSARAPVSQRTQQPLRPLTKEEKAFAQRYQFETAPGKVRDMRAQQAKQAQEDYKKKMAKEAEAKKQAEKDRRMKSEVEAYESSQRRNKSIPITSYYHYFD
jgi:hypothetical protein